jgi:hypothetical protein
MLEIYNEVITDLLNPSGSNLQIREDIKRGCYVEDLSEQLIQNGECCSLHPVKNAKAAQAEQRPGVRHTQHVQLCAASKADMSMPHLACNHVAGAFAPMQDPMHAAVIEVTLGLTPTRFHFCCSF